MTGTTFGSRSHCSRRCPKVFSFGKRPVKMVPSRPPAREAASEGFRSDAIQRTVRLLPVTRSNDAMRRVIRHSPLRDERPFEMAMITLNESPNMTRRAPRFSFFLRR